MDDNELTEALNQLQLKHGLILSNTETQLALDLARAARTAERERCAKVCESVSSSLESADEDAQAMSIGAQSCADQIRAGA